MSTALIHSVSIPASKDAIPSAPATPAATPRIRVIHPGGTAPTLAPDGRPVRILLLGAGTVGGAFAQLVARRSGARITQAIVRDARRPRAGIPANALSTLDQPIDLRGIDVCVEALGGIEPALGIARRVLAAGIPYVTANKTLVAAHGEELAALAGRHGTVIRFEAAVGAAIPCIRILRDALKASRIRRVYGILNGTSHFILGEWLKDGASFDDALRAAQARGYAEACPQADLSGDDAAQKLSILHWQICGRLLSPSEVSRIALPTLRQETLETLAACGYAVKPAACLAWRADGSPEAWVAPAAVPVGTLLAASSGPSAVLVVETEDAGCITIAGEGAGGKPTATALLDDVVEVLARPREVGRDGRPCALPAEYASRPEISSGTADGPKQWVVHIPVGSGLRPGEIEKRLGFAGGWIGRQKWFPGGRCVLTLDSLPWDEELTAWLVGRGACLLEVLR